MNLRLPQDSPRTKAYIFFLIVAIIWGIAGPVIKFTLGGFSPLVFLVYRFAISTVVALVIFTVSRIRIPKNPSLFWLAILYSFLSSTVGLAILFYGYENTSVLYATLISAIAPILVAVGGVIFLKEHLTSREKVGIGIASAGTVVSILGPSLNGNGDGNILGNLLVLLSLFVGVATAVMGKNLLRDDVSAMFLTNLSFIVGFVTLLPVLLFTTSFPEIVNQLVNTRLSFHLGVIYMALFSGTLAYYLWHKAQKTIEIGEGGLFAYLYPLFSTPLAVFWLKEKITTPFIIGAIIIALGVFIAEYKKQRITS